jgi:hypothetical protein
MHLSPKQHFLIKSAGFIFLLVLLFLLNKQQENNTDHFGGSSDMVVLADLNSNGLTPVAIQLPRECQGMLPLKLVSLPNSFFLYLVNKSIEIRTGHSFIQLKNSYLYYCQNIDPGAFIFVKRATGNIEIR